MTPGSGVVPTSSNIQSALRSLLSAVDLATRLGCPPVEVALLLSELQQDGATDEDLRALRQAGHVEAVAGVPRLLLTPQGAAFARRVLAAARDGDRPQGVPNAADVPCWDSSKRELWWRGRCVKRFQREGGNQRLLLAAFQAQCWAARIEDPFPARTGVNPKKRLRETIKSLNRGQAALRFRGDGSSRGVRWEAPL
jgi:hypothetical protein